MTHLFIEPAAAAQARLIAGEAFNALIDTLESYSNDLGAAHMDALWDMLYDMSKMAHGLLRGRRAYPLSCGLGKTQSVIALCAALYKRKSDRSVAIAASKVEALAEIKRHLVRHGVAEEAIGLTHSYRYDAAKAEAARRGEVESHASEPSTVNNDARQFHLFTHQRIRNGTPVGEYHTYRDKTRDLLVWDESLMSSDCRTIDYRVLESAFGGIAPWIEPASPMRLYLRSLLDTIGKEVQRQLQPGAKPQAIDLPELDASTIGKFKRALPAKRGVNIAPLQYLLEMSQSPLRVLLTNQGLGVVTYEIVVPASLRSVAILDASYPIRALERMDGSITLGLKPSPDLKRYDNVVIRHVSTGSGRDRMTRDFTGGRLMCSEVVDVVRQIPPSEAVIIWTFKEGTDKVNFVDILKRAMVDAGIDTEAKIQGDKARFIFRTFGQETSDSNYAYAANSIFAGVLFRSEFDLASCVIGQRDDRWSVVDQQEIRRIMLSEATHSVFQAICRGSCRMIEGSQAKAHHVWLPVLGKSILNGLAEVMPGVQLKAWNTKFIAAGKLNKIISLIEDYLDGLPLTTTRLGIQSLKRELGLKPEEKRTFSRALAEYLDRPQQSWERNTGGRSLIRTWDFGPEEGYVASDGAQR